MRTATRAVQLALALVFLCATSASAMCERAERDLTVLRTVKRDYKVFGTVCEEVARLRLADQYRSDRYDIETGIEYKSNGRTIGELDVVVFDRRTSEAIVIAEVKCWTNMSSGHKKAMDQLSRFQRSVNDRIIDEMRNLSTGKRYKYTQFDEDIKFITASQAGGESAGFEMTLGYGLNDFTEMSQKLQNK